MGAESYITYDAYRSGMDELERTGVAPCITLPFAARQGHVVNIGGREYRLEAPVTEDGKAACGTTLDGEEIVGFKVAPL